MTDKDKIVLFLDLWKSENTIKTNKLMMFFTIQSILVATHLVLNDAKLKWVIPTIGLLFSIFWFFSLGNTLAHQKYWKRKIEELTVVKTNNLSIFPTSKLELPFYGRISSQVIAIGVLILGFVVWAIILTVLFLK